MITIHNPTIHNPTININLAQTEMARALFASLLRGDEPEASPHVPTHHVVGRPLIGQYLESQGGIFAGDFHSGDGSIYGLIVASEQDIGRATWGANGERDLSDWDGRANTKALRKDCPAAKLAAEYQRDEHSDFYLPARRELLLAAANLHDSFGKESWYWTSTPYAEHYAWAVDFEHGNTSSYFRHFEFRVRPFRRFIY